MALSGPRVSAIRAGARGSVFRNAASLYGTTLITSALGFAYWVLAAHIFPINSVGIATAAMSAMWLLAEFGLLGMGTLIIGELAQDQGFPVGLVSAASLVSGTASFALGLAYVAAEPLLSTKLGALGHGAAGPLLFACGTGVTGVTLVLDMAVIGLNRGSLQLVRNTVFAVVKLAVLPLCLLVPTSQTSAAIYAAWLVGNLASLIAFFVTVRRVGITPNLRPSFRSLGKLKSAAFAHHWLNLSAQMPRLVLPVLVNVALTPALTAAYYTASLIVGFVSIIPIQLATALFALPRGQLERMAVELRGTLRLSFLVSAVSAVVIAVVARPVLFIFGHEYQAATGAMAVLGFNSLPFAVKVHYASVERVRDRLMRCAAVSTAGGVLEIGLAFVGIKIDGLTGLSSGLLVATAIEALILWPVVARAAQVPILNPSWMWRIGSPVGHVGDGDGGPAH